jgi:phosphoglycerate kinase
VRTLEDVEVGGKVVVVRVDFNVPLDAAGKITDDARIRAALPDARRAARAGRREARAARPPRAAQGRAGPEVLARSPWPTGSRSSWTTTSPAEGPEEAWGDGDRLLMLENVRFFPGRDGRRPGARERYAGPSGDVFVDDAFGAAHRAHASNHGIAKLLPSAAGLLLQREVETLTGILADPGRPMVAIVGGSKVTDKLGVLERFLELADTVLIGGAMCFPFFAAQGHRRRRLALRAGGGSSPPARCSRRPGPASSCCRRTSSSGREFSAETDVKELDGTEVPAGWMGLDVGPRTAKQYAQVVKAAGSAFWNGPMGAFELEPFAAGTRPSPRRWRRPTAPRSSAAGLRRRPAEVRPRGRGHPPLDGRRRLPRAHRGQALPGVEVLS